jgi:1-acyl-sn-glycerol-3-phosphate acyltransferase
MQRNTLRAIVSTLFKWFSRVEVVGLEHVPAQGGCILAANHLGRLDAPLVFAVLDRQDLTALVADKYLKDPLMRWLVKTARGIWVNREDADLQAMRTARSFLQAGGMLGIAPEGTRSPGGLLQGKTGVAYLADKAGVPILPAAISGSENAAHELLRLRRPRLRIQFGEAFTFPPIVRERRDRALLDNTAEIMCRIAAMLPAKYHGFYAGHPRLQALLSGERLADLDPHPIQPAQPV